MPLNNGMKSISSLLEALSRLGDDKDGPSLGGDDAKGEPVAAKISVTTAHPVDGDTEGGTPLAMHGLPDDLAPLAGGDDGGAPSDDDPLSGLGDPSTDQPDAAQDGAIVDILQSQFPEVYEKIDKMLSAGS